MRWHNDTEVQLTKLNSKIHAAYKKILSLEENTKCRPYHPLVATNLFKSTSMST